MAKDKYEGGDYPYKLGEAISAGVPQEVAHASRDLIEAQHTYFNDPSDENYELREQAVSALQDVRSGQRSGRPSTGIHTENDGGGE